MPVVKFTAFFKSNDGYGWSESHFKDGGSGDPPLNSMLASFVADILTRRAAMLSGDCTITTARASYPKPGTVASLPIGVNLPGNGGQVGGDESDSAAVMMYNAITNAKKLIHLRGIWRILIANEELDFTTPEALVWQSLFLDYKSYLVNRGYGWLSKVPGTAVKAANVNYVVNADNTITFQWTQPPIPDPGNAGNNFNRTIEVRFSGFNHRASILNRTLLCKWINTLELTTIRQIAAVSEQTSGKLNYGATAFQNYSDYAKISAGTRKMGKVSGRLPGRSRVQQLS